MTDKITLIGTALRVAYRVPTDTAIRTRAAKELGPGATLLEVERAAKEGAEEWVIELACLPNLGAVPELTRTIEEMFARGQKVERWDGFPPASADNIEWHWLQDIDGKRYPARWSRETCPHWECAWVAHDPEDTTWIEPCQIRAGAYRGVRYSGVLVKRVPMDSKHYALIEPRSAKA